MYIINYDICICNIISKICHMSFCIYAGFFLEIIFRGGETKFSRNEGGQAKIHKIYVYVVHTLNTINRHFFVNEKFSSLRLLMKIFHPKIFCILNFSSRKNFNFKSEI